MLGVLVDWFESVPDMPWLDVPYCILMAVFLREHKGSIKFAVNHPIASLVILILYVQANVICVHLLLGLPLVGCLNNAWDSLTAVLCWWGVFFCPGDLFFKAVQLKPIQLAIAVICEARHARLVMHSCQEGNQYFPQHTTIIILCGVVDGSAVRLMMSLDRKIRGEAACESDGENELKQVTEVTKASFVLGVFNALILTGKIPLSPAEGVFFGALFMVALLLNNILLGRSSPFIPIQGAFWKVVCSKHQKVE